MGEFRSAASSPRLRGAGDGGGPRHRRRLCPAGAACRRTAGGLHRHPGGRCAFSRRLRPFPSCPARPGGLRQRPGGDGRRAPGLHPGPDLAEGRSRVVAGLRPRPRRHGPAVRPGPCRRRHHARPAEHDPDRIRQGAGRPGADPLRCAPGRPALRRGPLGEAGAALELVLERRSAPAEVAEPLLARYWTPAPHSVWASPCAARPAPPWTSPTGCSPTAGISPALPASPCWSNASACRQAPR